jgi:DsbC/DsbD-like thiol-disulfide interchange protein
MTKPILLAFALTVMLAAGTAHAAFGEWAEGDKARVRLIAAGVDANGKVAAGIEIELNPGWHTYWRNPGDAGLPPAFDFSASKNIAEPEVAFPPPHRLDDGFSVSNVYEDRVVLPLTAKAGGDPAELVMSLDIGVCAEVCVPEHFEASVAVPGDKTDKAVADLLDEARALLPGKPEPGAFDVTAVARKGGSDAEPKFDISILAPEPESATVFVETPPDWYAGPPVFSRSESGTAVFTVTFDRKTAKTPIAGSSLRVTAIADGRAIERTVTLD